MKLFIFLLIISLFGCNKIIKKTPSETLLYEKKIQELDWNSITMYPAMGSCDTILDKEIRGKCFFKTLNDTLENRLIKSKLYQKQDSVIFDVFITNTGILSLTEKDSIKHIPDSILQKILTSFPKIEPAQKKDIFVNSSFSIKLKVSNNN
ncbi:MAG: hypothetical protein ACOVQ2_04645 [Flavobacterium sp.]